jgi:hypothetical protein
LIHVCGLRRQIGEDITWAVIESLLSREDFILIAKLIILRSIYQVAACVIAKASIDHHIVPWLAFNRLATNGLDYGRSELEWICIQ